MPGHKGGPGAAPRLLEAVGAAAVALDIPALTQGRLITIRVVMEG